MRFENGLVLIGVLVALPAFAKEPVAVVELQNESTRIKVGEVQFLTDMLRGAARNGLDPAHYSVMTRESMEVMVPAKEMRCMAESCLIDIGKRLQAAFVVGGGMKDVGKEIGITLEAYETQGGTLKGSATETAANVKDAVRVVRTMAAALIRQMTGVPAQAVPSAAPSATTAVVPADVQASRTLDQERRDAEAMSAIRKVEEEVRRHQAEEEGRARREREESDRRRAAEREAERGREREATVRKYEEDVQRREAEEEARSKREREGWDRRRTAEREAEEERQSEIDSKKASAERAKHDPELFRSWDTGWTGIGLAPVPGRYLTTSGGHKMILPLSIGGYGLNFHAPVISVEFAVGGLGIGAAQDPEGTNWGVAGVFLPVEFNLTFRFAKGFPLGLRVGGSGLVDLWETSSERPDYNDPRTAHLAVGLLAGHLVYEFGTREGDVSFEVAAGFEYLAWKARWMVPNPDKKGYYHQEDNSGGDPMGGAQVFMTVPLSGTGSSEELRLVFGAGYYRGSGGAQDVQWLLHFRYYKF